MIERRLRPVIANLQRARDRLGWSMRELADRAGVPVSMVTGLESGASPGDLATVSRLLDAMGLELRVAPKQEDSPAAIAERRRTLAAALAGGKGRHR